MPRTFSHRYRLQLSVVESDCPECGELLVEDQLEGGEVTCVGCAHVWSPELEAVDPLTDDRRRFRFLERDELYRRLAAIARQRDNTIGRRYLAEHDPELLFNCVAHHSTYATARRYLRRWMAENPPSAPRVVVRPRDELPLEAGAEPPPETDADGEAPARPPSTSDSGVRLLATRARAEHTCPYCRDVFEEDEVSFTCECGAIFHPECREELGRCTTLGCGAPYVRSVELAGANAEAAAEEHDAGFLEALHERLFGARLRLTFSLPWSLRLFGLPFLAGGLGLVGAILPELFAQASGAALVVLPIAAAFLILGLSLVFGCRGATLDKSGGWVRVWRGLRVPLLFSLPLWSRDGRQQLAAFREVRLRRDVWYRGKKGNGVTVFPVALDGEDLTAERDYLRARRTAERVGQYLELGVRDTVGRSEGRRGEFRPAGTLDRPFVDGLHEAPRVGGQPRAGRITVEAPEGEAPVYVVPGQRNLTLPLTLGAALVIALLWMFGAQLPPSACLVLGATPVLATLLHAMRRAAKDRIQVTPHGLRLRRRWWVGGFRWTIPARALEEMIVSAQKRRTVFHSFGAEQERVLNLISDARILEVGAGLSDDELHWLRRSLARDLLGAEEAPPKA